NRVFYPISYDRTRDPKTLEIGFMLRFNIFPKGKGAIPFLSVCWRAIFTELITRGDGKQKNPEKNSYFGITCALRTATKWANYGKYQKNLLITNKRFLFKSYFPLAAIISCPYKFGYSDCPMFQSPCISPGPLSTFVSFPPLHPHILDP